MGTYYVFELYKKRKSKVIIEKRKGMGSREECVGLKESEEVRLPFADRYGLGPAYHL